MASELELKDCQQSIDIPYRQEMYASMITGTTTRMSSPKDYASTMDLNPQTIGRLTQSREYLTSTDTYGAYKWVDQKIKPGSQRIPPEFKVTCTISYDPLTTLVPINENFTDLEPTQKFT